MSLKLQDLATLLRDYLDWLQSHELQDADRLLHFATETLRSPHPPLSLGGIWVDGFAEFSPQELDLLVELLPHAPQSTITFCLDRVPTGKVSWLSNGSMVESAYQECRKRLSKLPDCQVTQELLPRVADQGRFAHNPVLRHLEAHWADSEPGNPPANVLEKTLRIAECANPEAEAILAAREILRFVRNGGRYREVTVLARTLQPYHEILANIFNRYEIPCFLDRRESVSHHPLAELTRNALRTVAYSWAHADWFAALKTGLVPAGDDQIDELENEALARGWTGKTWQQPLSLPEFPELGRSLERLRLKIVPPFNKLALEMARRNNKPNGTKLAEGLREFWSALNVAETLQQWSIDEADQRAIHLTVWEQMSAWLENVELAFPAESLPLREWLPVLDAGLAGLTVGVIPPALDQVFIGAIDRSRNPDIRLAIVLGMNETIFPAPPVTSVLLTEADRLALEKQGIPVANNRQRLGQERFYGLRGLHPCARTARAYLQRIGFRRQNPEPFAVHHPATTTVPVAETEKFPRSLGLDAKANTPLNSWCPLLQNQIRAARRPKRGFVPAQRMPEIASVLESFRHLATISGDASLSPALAAQLYGPELRTSVSRMEQFAACPFKFFVHSGLRAEERELFELDYRDQGNFQHDVLEFFHHQLARENKRWRDITSVRSARAHQGHRRGARVGLSRRAFAGNGKRQIHRARAHGSAAKFR